FSTLLGRCRNAVLDVHAHRNMPFEMLIDRLKPARDLHHTPLFQVALVQHNASGEAGPPIHGGGAIHELTWYMREADGRLTNTFEYRANLFQSETIDRIIAHVEAVLRSAVADRTRRVGEISVLTPQERRQVTVEFNATASELDSSPFTTQFERQATLG